MGRFTSTQERVLAITPKCGASLSIPCSLFLMYEVWCDHKTRGSTPIQRALVGMSIVDILRNNNNNNNNNNTYNWTGSSCHSVRVPGLCLPGPCRKEVGNLPKEMARRAITRVFSYNWPLGHLSSTPVSVYITL
eukprot:scaffold42784_cov214-Amphora_coffeaeformis.AAC.13